MLSPWPADAAIAPSPQRGEGWGEGRSPHFLGALPGTHLPSQTGAPSAETVAAAKPYIPSGIPLPGAVAVPLAQARESAHAAPVALPQPIPNLPDIDVAYLSRCQLYPAYTVDYPDGWTPVLRSGTAGQKRWPDPGEIVTFTAHVANHGLQPAAAFSYRWRIDGATVLTGTVLGLGAGGWVALTMAWPWDAARHAVSFDADTANAITEVTRQNNTLSDPTDALYLDIRVHPYAYAAFSHYQNARGSFTFEDWLQSQIAKMNERFAQAIYPEAPQGILDRVRVDSIRVITDVQSSLPNYDGGWQFDVPPDDPDTPENESVIWAEQYAAGNAKGIDWGLIHELTHQVGMIDLYQVGVEPDHVTLPGQDGLPLLMSYGCKSCDLMSGGDTSPYSDPTYYSSYTAAALNRNYGHRRGYYGEFLFDIPLTNVLVLQDNSARPLAGAQVQIYQALWNTLPQTPVISGVSDANGRFILPNRPVSVEITTATGHTLHANPFGRINVVGSNGMLLIKVSRAGSEDYLWKQILSFNMAYWQGLTSTYTFAWQTHLPPLDAPSPLPALTGRFEQGSVALSWEARAGASSYRVYKSDEPYDQWDGLGSTTGTSFVATPTWHTRYSVTVLDGTGRESGFAPIYRSFYWVYPSDAVFYPPANRWLVLDTHSGALVEILPDNRIVGNRVSAHGVFVGGQSLSLTSDNELAVVQEGSATVFDGRMRRTGYIGRSEFDPAPIDGATGILMAGKPFSTTVRPEMDARTLLLRHFDGDLASGGRAPVTAQVAFTTGVSGRSVAIEAGSRLVYTSTAHFDQQQGGLDVWVRPQWDGDSPNEHVFFSAGDGRRYLFQVGAADGWLYAYVTKFDGFNEAVLWADISDWRTGEWHHLGISWLPHWLKLYVDGTMADVSGLKRAVTGPLGMLNIGTDPDGAFPAIASLDELRISSAARVGNSDEVRLLVSEESRRRIEILDLMGNIIATWSDPAVQQPRALAAVPGGRVAVADTGDGSVKLLAFDGRQSLAYSSTLISGLGRPQNIKSAGDRLIVPDYRLGIVSIVNVGGDVLQRYTAPNDGYPGVFAAPASAAPGPWGDVLVADKGKQRVVFIRRGLPDLHLFLPVVAK